MAKDRVDLEELEKYRQARTIAGDVGVELITLTPRMVDRILEELRAHRALEAGVEAAIADMAATL